jgi:hypothetical protein
MIQRICSIIFFLLFGVSYFFPFAGAGSILAVDAIILGIAIIAQA